MRTSLLAVLVLSMTPPALSLKSSSNVYSCSYSDLKETGAMCYLRFHCMDRCPTYSKYTSYLSYVPICCLHPQNTFSPSKITSQTCAQESKTFYAGSSCEPLAHEVVKVKQPQSTPPSPPASISVWKLSWCPQITGNRLKDYPECCYHPFVYSRYKKLCTYLLGDKRSRRSEDDMSSLFIQYIDEASAPNDTAPTLPSFEDEDIEVKCCETNVTLTCRGLECIDACDDPETDTSVATIDISATADLCNNEISGDTSGGRRKRWAAATMASWRLNWCPGYVTSAHPNYIQWFKICCFHPSCRAHHYPGHGRVADYCHHQVSGLFAPWG